MARYLYTAWFRDPDAEESGQNYEWPECIQVTAETPEADRR
jgi:hypothetical protein